MYAGQVRAFANIGRGIPVYNGFLQSVRKKMTHDLHSLIQRNLFHAIQCFPGLDGAKLPL